MQWGADARDGGPFFEKKGSPGPPSPKNFTRFADRPDIYLSPGKDDSVKKKIITYTIPTVCGAFVSAALIMLSAAVSFMLGLKRDSAGGMAAAAFAAGCFVSGLLCGLIKKQGGLKAGAVCAGIMMIITAAVSLLSGSFTGAELPGRCICALLFACAGAVIGVNRRRD